MLNFKNMVKFKFETFKLKKFLNFNTLKIKNRKKKDLVALEIGID